MRNALNAKTVLWAAAFAALLLAPPAFSASFFGKPLPSPVPGPELSETNSSCAGQNGTICNENQSCLNESRFNASDTKLCCATGCVALPEPTTPTISATAEEPTPSPTPTPTPSPTAAAGEDETHYKMEYEMMMCLEDECGGGGGVPPKQVQYYYAGAGGLVAKGEPKNDGTLSFSFVHPDYLSSVRAVTDSAGSLSGYADFMPFGGNLRATINTRLRFTGKELDGGSGLYCMGARFYAPGIGRFLSVDPLFDGSATPYSYADNNPLRYNDPTGMAGEDSVYALPAVEVTARGPSFLQRLWRSIFGDQAFMASVRDSVAAGSYAGRPVVTQGDFSVVGDVQVAVPRDLFGAGLVYSPPRQASAVVDFSHDAALDSVYSSLTGGLGASPGYGGQLALIQRVNDAFHGIPYSRQNEVRAAREFGPVPALVGRDILFGGYRGGVCRSLALAEAGVLQRMSAEGFLRGWQFTYNTGSLPGASSGHAWVEGYPSGYGLTRAGMFVLDPTSGYFGDPAYYPYRVTSDVN